MGTPLYQSTTVSARGRVNRVNRGYITVVNCVVVLPVNVVM